MYCIELYRYIVKPETSIQQDRCKIVEYVEELYKSQLISYYSTTYDRLVLSSKAFLRDHYGYVNIYQDDEKRVKLTNHKKMVADFNQNHIQLHKAKHEKVL
jgi:hypothetical protein